MVWEFSKATLETRRQCSNVFSIPNENDFPPRNLYLARLQINFESRIETFQELKSLKAITSHALQELFENMLY